MTTEATMLDLESRLAAVHAAASRGSERTAAQSVSLLAQRARALAVPVAVARDREALTFDAVVCEVGDERFAISLGQIVAVSRSGPIAPLPRAVRPVFGVTAWRGRPLTVLTLQAARPRVTGDTRLLVLGSGARAALALVVDAVHDIISLSPADLTAPGSGPRHDYALGITDLGVLVLDGEALLHTNRLQS